MSLSAIGEMVSAEEVDEYLRRIEEPKRSTLEALRRTILEVLPDAEQVISYRVPAFRVGGETVAGFAAFQNHLSYLPFSGSVLPQLAGEFEDYTMTKSALHFPVERPLSKALVKKLIARASPRSTAALARQLDCHRLPIGLFQRVWDRRVCQRVRPVAPARLPNFTRVRDGGRSGERGSAAVACAGADRLAGQFEVGGARSLCRPRHAKSRHISRACPSSRRWFTVGSRMEPAASAPRLDGL
jgi:uncharacterized protein YdhG (YjbR/CyaY superfamily)